MTGAREVGYFVTLDAKGSEAIDASIEVAQSYVDQACELLAPFEDRPTAVALQGASRHLLASLDATRAQVP